ncbi:MAG: bifunctional pyr operon transcriptional regulator/uracil phosphoribosyltransferase PyrR [Opitutales bacterium]
MTDEVQRTDGSVIKEEIDRLVRVLAETFGQARLLAVAGIADGGIPFGQMLAGGLSQALDREIPYGTVNIAFHRDDIGQRPIPPATNPTDLPFDVEEATILLADDVIFSGRSARAGINEVFDQGRPERLVLVVLVDRGGRRLPVQPDFIAMRQDVPVSDNIEVHLNQERPQDSYIERRPA